MIPTQIFRHHSRLLRRKVSLITSDNYQALPKHVILPRYYSTDTVFNDLSNILSQQGVTNQSNCISKSASVLENVSQDASSYAVHRPDICIIPSNVRQIQHCVKYCYDQNIPMVPVGARTGLEGGIHAMEGGVSFDMSQMTDILQFNQNDLDCHVQAGLSWRQLNDNIKSDGLWFPVDPGASATLGGMSSTSASGTNAVKYGTMRENVLGLEIVVADGKIIRTSGEKCRSKKSSAGLNMTNVYVGSEGTLGIITSVRLKLHPLPSCVAIATVAFPDVKSAVDSVVQVMQSGLPVARVEFLDALAVQACYLESKLPNLDPTRPMLFVELHGLTESSLQEQIELVKDIFESHEVSKFNWSTKLEERTQLWKARHNLHWSVQKMQPGFVSVDTDICVPISNFPEIIKISHELVRKYDMKAPLLGHAGDGNFHAMILYDPKKPEQLERAKTLAYEMGEAAIQLEGTVTGEHGVGRGKLNLLEKQFDQNTLDTMYLVKKALDPKNLFNPGKMFRSTKLMIL